MGIAGPDGTVLKEFSVPHTQDGFREFFSRFEHHQRKLGLPVAVTMERRGRPCPSPGLDDRGERLQTSPDVRKILELFHLKDRLPLAKDVLQEVPRIPPVNEKLKRLTRRRRQLVKREGAGDKPHAGRPSSDLS